MKDILQDVVSHTHALGFLPILKFTTEDNTTKIASLADDKSVILHAETKTAVQDFTGMFGMSSLDKLSLHLRNPEYQTDAKIEVLTIEKNGEVVPERIHFENKRGDFKNDYRFMSREIVNQQVPHLTFKGAEWVIVFQPELQSIQRFKLMKDACSEEPVFTVRSEQDNLVFSFGDVSTHAGSFVFKHNANGVLKHQWSWPAKQVLDILSVDGIKVMQISDQGAMQIIVDSELAVYTYTLPAQTK
jgi:hypothetical protein